MTSRPISTRCASRAAVWALAVTSPALAACSGAPSPSMLDPQGPRAARVTQLGWLMFVLAIAIFLIVAATLLYGLLRRRPSEEGTPGAAEERFGPTFWVVVGGIGAPAVILSVLMVLSVATMAAVAAPDRPTDLTIEVNGRQFWWEVRYAGQSSVTANEIHVPAGRPVELKLTADDVIHSFWIPQLQGKIDTIPGKVNSVWLQADRPGVYRGQCAEFCGIQHAHMALYVVADPPDEFARWLAAQAQPAQQPADSLVQRGAQVFAREGCITCHTVRYGAQAIGGGSGTQGPDLTHLASRRTIASGTLENTRGNLAGWVVDAQGIKPGSGMPPRPMDGDSLQALLAYLESLR